MNFSVFGNYYGISQYISASVHEYNFVSIPVVVERALDSSRIIRDTISYVRSVSKMTG